jgi:hypothetical protein
MRAAIQQAPAFQPSTLVSRIADVADAARDARVKAYASGNARLGAQLGDAEVRAVQVLIERFKLDHDKAVDELQDAGALARAVARVIQRAPQLGTILGEILETERPGLAEQVRTITAKAQSVSENKQRQEIPA